MTLVWPAAPGLSRIGGLALICLLSLLGACGDGSGDSGSGGSDQQGVEGSLHFQDITSSSGITFKHRTGATGRRYMPECMGSGVAVIDFDGDGLQDLYFIQSGPLGPGGGKRRGQSNHLYRNLGGMRFENVTQRAAAAGAGYGMGAVVGDYDNDGFPDLYVTCFGSNLLLRNNGDGTFSDRTQHARVDDDRWSTGAAFLDFDADGHLDLLVQNYVDFTFKKHRRCYSGKVLVYCTPDFYDGVPATLFKNNGDGTFSDVSDSSTIGSLIGKGLGVCVSDLDDDGHPDIYLANDTLMNFLFHGEGGGRFEEVGLISGAGYGEDGREEAGMGVDAADIDGDGRLDLIVTNFLRETNSLYRNVGEMMFSEVSRSSGTTENTINRLGFGVRFFDFDNDGIQDILVANGHVYDNGHELTPPVPHAQPPALFMGEGGLRFRDVSGQIGPAFTAPMVGRGLALADLDNDGDLDAVFATNGGRARLMENVGGNTNAWISVRLVGTVGDTTAIGARVTITAGGKAQTQEVRSGGSYLSQSDLRLFFGLGDCERIDSLRVKWRNGSEETARKISARQHLVFTQGKGLK